MPQYELTTEGINNYFKEAYSSMFEVEPEYDYKDTENFFNCVKKELKVKISHDEYDYHDILKKLNDDNKKTLWVIRLRNVCNILYNIIEKYGEFNYIILGIFGSNKVTSDIDIGVSYKVGTNLNNHEIKKLSFFIEKFEKSFVEMKYTSLDIDVEMYADYFLSIKDGAPFIKTTEVGFEKCLPIVLSGILKNRIQAFFDSNEINDCDTRRLITKIKNQKCMEHDVNTEIEIAKEGLINEFKLLIITHVSGKQVDKCKNILNKITKSHLNEATTYLKKYMNADYPSACKIYYNYLDKAHELYKKYFFKSQNEKTMNELSKAISNALIFRAESHICAPTIYHIVYKLQGNNMFNNIDEKITNLGYEISTLEQLGFMNRFNIVYKDDFTTGNRKYDKYHMRLENALNNINIQKSPENVKSKSKTIKKSSKPSKRTKTKSKNKSLKSNQRRS